MRSSARLLLMASLLLALPCPCEAQATGPASGSRDSLWNGTVIGAAVGAASGIAYSYAVRDSDLDAGQYAYGALIFGAIGAGVGLGLDALLDRGWHAAPRAPRRVALRPSFSRRTAGLRVVLRW